MITTGYKLQLRIKDLKREIESNATLFDNGKTRFHDEDKPSAEEAYMAFRRAEEELALLQAAQGYYNNTISVEVLGKKMSLSRAIKLLGGAGRGEAMWRSLVAPKKDRYMRSETEFRDKDKVYASPTYTMELAREKAKEASALAAALRQAIQEGNAQTLDIPDSVL